MSAGKRGVPFAPQRLTALALAVGLAASSAAQAQVAPKSFYALNADGTGWRKIFQLEGYPACGSPAVSPDGKEFAFDGWQVAGNQQQGPALVFIVGMDGTNCATALPGADADLVAGRKVPGLLARRAAVRPVDHNAGRQRP